MGGVEGETDDIQAGALSRALADLPSLGRIRVRGTTGEGVVVSQVGRGPVVFEVGASQFARCEPWLAKARADGLEVREVGGSARVALGRDADEVIAHVLDALHTIDGVDGSGLVTSLDGGTAQRW